MLGLTAFGALHTLISLVALAAGLMSLARYKDISLRTRTGKTYVIATVLTCVTGFFIFHHGGFGPPHMLGIITLVVLVIAWMAGRGRVFGRASRYVETVSYSATFFFHLIPGATETFTRLPVGAPLFSGPDDPALQKVIGVLFVLVAVGVVAQLLRLRATPQPSAGVLR